jgi:hypothetical protein
MASPVLAGSVWRHRRLVILRCRCFSSHRRESRTMGSRPTAGPSPLTVSAVFRSHRRRLRRPRLRSEGVNLVIDEIDFPPTPSARHQYPPYPFSAQRKRLPTAVSQSPPADAALSQLRQLPPPWGMVSACAVSINSHLRMAAPLVTGHGHIRWSGNAKTGNKAHVNGTTSEQAQCEITPLASNLRRNVWFTGSPGPLAPSR